MNLYLNGQYIFLRIPGPRRFPGRPGALALVPARHALLRRHYSP